MSMATETKPAPAEKSNGHSDVPAHGLTDGQLARLSAPLDNAEVSTRQQSGKTLSYVEGHYCIRKANEIFGPAGWTRRTEQMECVAEREFPGTGKHKGKTGYFVAYRAHCNVSVKTVDGWIDTDGWGYGEATTYINIGQGHESAVKEAETDAMKRALMRLGDPFGLALYDKQQKHVVDNGNGRPQAPRQQPQPQQQAPPPAQTKPPQRMDNLPEGVPQNIGELRNWMTANGYAPKLHAGILQGMAGNPTLGIETLGRTACVSAWQRLEKTRQAASQEAPEPEPPAPEPEPPAPEPERMDNPLPDDAPQTPGDLAMYLSNQGVAPEQHDDVVNALTRLTVPNAKRRKIGELDAAMCAEIWRRHQDSDTTMDDQPEPAPEPEPVPTVSEFAMPEWTAEEPPHPIALSQWFGKLGLSKGQLAEVRKKAKITPGKRVALFDGLDCWAWYCALLAMASRDEGGELRLNIQAEVAA